MVSLPVEDAMDTQRATMATAALLIARRGAGTGMRTEERE